MSNALRALIVEDSEDDAVMLLRELRRAGYEVVSERVETAAGMNAALDRAAWDVVLSDYSMPHFSAPAALAVLKQRQIDIPFIIISGTIGEETAVNAMKAGAHDYLMKGKLARLFPALERELREAEIRRERHRAEEALRRSESYLSAGERLSHTGSWAWNLKSGELYWSQETFRIFGFDPTSTKASVAETFLARIHPEDRPRIGAGLVRASGVHETFEDDYRIVHPDGSIRDVHEIVYPVTDETGTVVERFGVILDVTERKRAEAENSRLAAVVNWSDDAIFSATREGFVATWNGGAERMYGYAAEEIKGESIEILIPEGGQSAFSANREKLISGEALRHYEFEHLRKDGSRLPVLLTLSPIKDAMGVVTGVSVISHDITARKRAEEQLREEKNRAQVYLDIAGVMLLALNPDQEVELINLKGCEILGYGREEIIGKKWCDNFVPARDRDRLNRVFENLKVGELEMVEYLENPIERKTGEERLIAWHNTVLRDRSGKIVSTLSSGEDITERMRARAELEKQHNFVEAVLDNAQSGIIACDDQGVLTIFNRASREIFGLPPANILPDEWAQYYDLYLADGKTRMEKEDVPLFRALQGEHLSNLEMTIVPKSGAPRAVLTSGQPIIDANGRNLGAVVAFHDISERKRAEAEHRRLMTAIEQAVEGVMITDAKGEIQYVNPAFSTTAGYSREEVMGKNPSILKSGEHDAAFYETLWTTISAGQVWSGELINRRKDGRLYTEKASITPVFNAGGEITHFIAMMEDITARKLLEDQFRQAQKMEAVGRLAGGVAHDFNNLLTIINGYSDLLLDQFVASDHRWTYLTEIKHAGERAEGLTRQLLAFSRQQVLAPRVLDLNFLVGNVTKMLKRLIGEDIDLVFSAAATPVTIKADPGHIEQVLMNLAVNARDAMPRGGKLTIENSYVRVDEALTNSHHLMPAGSYVMLAVSDTGCGMDKETQSHIFEPFFTTKAAGKGTGLGLATVYGIVQQSGGHIWVYSEPGVGTTFKIYFPTVGGAPEAAKVVAVAAGGSETILLVEDDFSLRGLARMILEDRGGYRVLEAAGGKEALQLAGEHTEAIQLLLTDVVMPEMSGRELGEKIAALRPEIRVLYMSGYTDDSVVRHGVLEEGTAFVQKPFSPESLLRKVREALDARPRT